LSILRVDVPRKLKPLLGPRRYKGAYGGRGGAKSHFFAEQIIVQCLVKPTRVVCIREVQNSIKDSVKQLLIDKIEKLGLLNVFDVLESEIRGPSGSQIVFKGMQSYNAANIKSLEGYDIAWVEEAQTLSQHSLDLLRPTLRKDGSELWFSWNPRFKTDPVDKFFRKSPPEDAVSVLINWRDNPWFPDVLQREMAHDFAVDPDKAEHIWNGAYGFGQGAILARWVAIAERNGRILDVEADPDGAPLVISSDIGFRDTASWWFWQPQLGGYKILKYVGASGMDADDWIPELKKLITATGVPLGRIWLPHDARAKTFQSSHTTVDKFLTAFGTDHIAVVPQTKKLDQISAARTVINQCAFDKLGCEDGLDGLRAWEYEFNDETGAFSREPLHNWASHPSDAFAYGCQVMQLASPPPPKPEDMRGITVGQATVSLEEMWREAPRQTNKRI